MILFDFCIQLVLLSSVLSVLLLSIMRFKKKCPGVGGSRLCNPTLPYFPDRMEQRITQNIEMRDVIFFLVNNL